MLLDSHLLLKTQLSFDPATSCASSHQTMGTVEEGTHMPLVDTADTVPNVMPLVDTTRVEQPPGQTTIWDRTLGGPAPVPWSTVPLRDVVSSERPPALRKVTVVPPPPWHTFVEIYVDFGASVRFVLSEVAVPDCRAWGCQREDPWVGRWLEPDEVLPADVDIVRCWHR